jgi:hypothetical protein
MEIIYYEELLVNKMVDLKVMDDLVALRPVAIIHWIGHIK